MTAQSIDQVMRAAAFELERWQRNANMALSDFQRMAELDAELVFQLHKLASRLSTNGHATASRELLEVVSVHHKACMVLIQTICAESERERVR